MKCKNCAFGCPSTFHTSSSDKPRHSPSGKNVYCMDLVKKCPHCGCVNPEQKQEEEKVVKIGSSCRREKNE